VKPGELSPRSVQHAVAIMGGVAALRWPLALYEGGLMGLQRQVLLNSVRIGAAVLGGGGAVIVLMMSPTIIAYFLWQMVVAALNVAVIAVLLWRSVPHADRRPVFDSRLLYSNWRFAAGMSGISVSAIVLTQLDKILLSKMLPLEMFGYYTLAGIVSGVVPMLFVAPVFNAVYPRFTALVAAGEEREVARLYHSVTQLMAVLAVSVSAVLGFLAFDIVRLWTGSSTTAAATAPIIGFLVIGMALNALMTVPFALEIAHGWTGIGLRINLVLAAALVPALIALTNRFGAVGGASTWALLNAAYMAVGVPLTHRRLLPGEMRAWFFRDIIGPAAIASVIAAAGRYLMSQANGSLARLLTAGVVLGASMLGASLAAPLTRGILQQYVPKLWQARP
jgi:O-antigen/teichoic acid export membrane protein